jgi:protein TonB
MFEDALMESDGRISTHRGWFSGVAAICNGSIVGIFVLLPLLHPASLPKQTLSMLLAAPAPPATPPPQVLRVANTATHAATLVNPFTPPLIVPTRISTVDQEPPAAIGIGVNALPRENGTLLNGIPVSIGTAMPPQVHLAPPRKPVISSGVMEGRKLSGAEPRYPTIAVVAHIQGTVFLSATISRTGVIENLRVVSGPPMLAPAAAEAVRTWRYRPYLLNGEPVEVETTVRVIFNLGG